MNGSGRTQGELTIGIVGPHELVERIMLPPSGMNVAGTASTPAARAYSYGTRLAKRQTSMAVPSRTRLVCEPHHASGVSASEP